MINAVFFRTDIDDTYTEPVIRDASGWADQVFIVGREAPTEDYSRGSYLQIPYETHKQLFQRTWTHLTDFVPVNEWVVLLNCDELVWSKDALVRLSKDKKTASIAFERHLMWDSTHFHSTDKPVLIRALRHTHGPIAFPDADMRFDHWQPMLPVANYIPVGKILALRWSNIRSEFPVYPDHLKNPWPLAVFEEGEVRT